MKYLAFVFLVLYIYCVTFAIFLTDFIRIPAPIMFGLPLVFIFKAQWAKLQYGKEIVLFTLSIFLYYYIGLSDNKEFFSNAIKIVMCALFFSYFVGDNKQRFTLTIFTFYALLTFSALLMVFNTFYPEKINALRTMLLGEPVMQSPSGIAVYQFTFGYQLAALVPFLFIFTFAFKKPLIVKAASLVICLIFIYLGMQRSVLIGFTLTVFLFLWCYYNYRSVFIVAVAVFAAVMLYTYVLKDNFDSYNNIITKNERNTAEYNRSALTAENLKIYTQYPYGLIFYGKNWSDVIYRNEVFSSGITSHNAYLMFFTYLGPFLGIGLLIGLYYKIAKIALATLRNVRKKENAMMICLCCSFFAVSINSLSHNSWLVNANGPTLFLYFSILHLHYLLQKSAEPEYKSMPDSKSSIRETAIY
ncbi:O-antigen ligase family protein [Pedobacter nyackensis]|uniref:O-antigen ligase-related domain-containing protein n=1 Tax=Pedobacter nyackensis TaxID=475255 RepID=A0A1W2DCE6_9SPHI|nr:O-antigen ligase family protein [Pedobacter nyackensis]SMC95140.1 hypothetical protein SAMN04488101_106187 [Pedobacter nyackensis]